MTSDDGCVTPGNKKKGLHDKQQLMGMISSVSNDKIIPQVFREVAFMFSFEKGTERLKVKKNIES